MGDWKAVRDNKKNWALYDLTKDISESVDVSKDHPEIMEKLKHFAAEAVTPMKRGEIYDFALTGKDTREGHLMEQKPQKKRVGK